MSASSVPAFAGSGIIPNPDPVLEGARIADAVAEVDLNFRLTGGVAVALRCPSASDAPLARTYADVDAVGKSKDRARITDFLGDLGYQAHTEFNALHGGSRLLFWDNHNGRQFDVFLDKVEMCHKIDLSKRVELSGSTLPLADLLLMKLQIVETNPKDLVDIIALLSDHPLTSDDSGINVEYLSALAANDWGLWRTITMVAERATAFAAELEDFDKADRIRAAVADFVDALEQAPKSRSWKLRAKIGERKRWYDLPEEVD